MVRTLISYTLAAGILTPPVILGNRPIDPDAQPSTSDYPLMQAAQPVQINTPILHNLPTVVPPPAIVPIPQTIAPQFVTYRPEQVPVASTSERLPPPEPPAPVGQEPTEFALDVETPETPDSSTDLTVLRDVTPQAHISSTAPLKAYDIMSGVQLWESTESLNVQANNHQVLLDDQAHTELILTVPDNALITVNGTDYPDGLIIRAQGNELYVINYLSGDLMMTVQPEIISPADLTITQFNPIHHWYDLDGRLPEQPPQIARRGSP